MMIRNMSYSSKRLPKEYTRPSVARDIKTALVHFRDLETAMEKYVYNNGTTKNLLSLTGTIPVVYDGTTYNIPVCVWLEKGYPQARPLCYVKPTRDMRIMRSQFVTGNGEVLLPYLAEWKAGECDLVSLLQVMSSLFGEVPPLRMQRQELAQESCSLQFRRESEVLSRSDGSLYVSVPSDKDDLFQQGNETSC